jgi:hypothetical protein
VLFDPRCVRWLDLIIKQTGAQIVLSSDWKKMGLERVKEMWKARNLPGTVINVTISLSGMQRKKEILEAVEFYNPKTWVAIDDMDLTIPAANFVQTDYKIGITYKTFKDSIKILNYDRQ